MSLFQMEKQPQAPWTNREPGLKEEVTALHGKKEG